MLTGELPGKKIEPPSTKVQIDVRLDEIVLRALEKNPELRYQQVSEVKTCVETIAQTPPVGKPKNPESKIPPRFSRLAILGAVCVPLSFVPIIWFVALVKSMTESATPMTHDTSWLNILFSIVGFMGLVLVAPLLTSGLGWVAVAQIRHSAGRLCGLKLALFDGLLFPVLMLDAMIVGLWVFLDKLLAVYVRHLGGSLFVNAGDFLIWALLLVLMLIWVDSQIIRRVWRAVNKLAASQQPVNPNVTKITSVAVIAIILAVGLVATCFFHAGNSKPAGLVATWRAENNGADPIGGNNGTAMNGLGFAKGEMGRGFNFNGANSFLLVNTTSNLNVGLGSGLTFEGWINPATLSHEVLIYEFENNLGTFNGGDTGINCGLHPERPGELDFNLVGTDRISHEIVSPLNTIVTNAWQHIAITYDKASGTTALYVNGAIVTLTNFGSFTPETSLPHLVIGARTTFNSVANPGDGFSGMMDKLSFYNRALTPAEIKTIYNDNPRGTKLRSKLVQNIPGENSAQLTQEGWQLWQARKLDEAAAKFQQAVQLAPGDANAWNGLGWAQFNAGNSAAAETSFRNAITVETNQPGALNGLGQIYLSQRKYDDAEKYLLQAAPQAPAAWFGLARLYLLERKFEQAEKWAQNIVDSGQADETDEENAGGREGKEIERRLAAAD